MTKVVFQLLKIKFICPKIVIGIYFFQSKSRHPVLLFVSGAGGCVKKTGRVFPIPAVTEEEEVWKKREHEQEHYLPLQAKEGDLAIFLQNAAYEISFDDEKYLIVPHSAVIMLIRDEELFE